MQTRYLTQFTIATNEYRGRSGERTEYHPCVAWDRLAEICGQFLGVEGRLRTRQWDDGAEKR
jgi:single-strand DNA-binding protein